MNASAVPAAAADALLAAMLVDIGSSLGRPIRLLLGLPIIVAGFAVAARAMWRVDDTRPVAWLPHSSFVLFVMAAVGLFTPSLHGALWYEAGRRLFSVLALAAVGVFAGAPAPHSRRAVTAVIVGAAVLHLATPLGVPQPEIDVWHWTQGCIRALLHGVHPYTVRPEDIAEGAFQIQHTAAVYPYMPLTLLAFAPGFLLFGDYRFVAALSVPVTVALNRASGARLGLDRRFIDATSLAFLLCPRAVLVTSNGWNEPLLVVAVSAFVYLAVRWPGGLAQAIVFLLLPGLKQYVIAPVLLYLAFKPRPRALFIVVAVAVTSATVAPFLLWAWRPTIDGILYQMIGPAQPRLDSYSLVALVAVLTGVFVSRWVSVAVQLIVAAIAGARLRRHGLAGLLLASSLALCATFLAGWQAFQNYYYLVSAMLLVSAITMAGSDRHAAHMSVRTCS